MSSKYYCGMIFIISLVSTLGSLYIWSFGDPMVNIWTGDLFNSSLAIIPCNLCRYIRLAMYPIVIASGWSLMSTQEKPYRTIWTLAVIWLWLCLYKYGLEMNIRSSGESFVCLGSASDCGVANPLYFWFVSLALLWALANAVMIVLTYRLQKTVQ